MFSCLFKQLPFTRRAIKVWTEGHNYVKINRCFNTLNNLNNKPRTTENSAGVHIPVENEINFRDLKGVVSDEQYREFMSYFPEVVEVLTKDENHENISTFTEYMKEVLEYNVPFEYNQSAFTAILAYKHLEKPENLTQENVKLANMLGWCMQLYHGHTKIADDIIDKASVRGTKPCWYKVKNAVVAFSDALILILSPYIIMQKYYSSRPCYSPILEIFHTATYKAQVGQNLDTTNTGKAMFNYERWKVLDRYKAVQTFTLPFLMAMYLANINDKHLLKQVEQLLTKLGTYTNAENDYFDAFGTEPTKGTNSSDIEEGKCSWMSSTAYNRANSAQRKLLEEYYGKPGEKSVNVVTSLYEELDLPAIFYEYKENTYNSLVAQIKQLPSNSVRQALFSTMEISYRRKCNH